MGKRKHKGTKWWITLAILVVVVAAVLFGMEYASNMLTELVNNQLREQVSRMDNVSVSYDDIEVDLWHGSAYVKNLRYCSNPDNVLTDSMPGFIVEAKMTQFQFVSYLSYLRKKEIKIGKVVTNDISAVANYVAKDTTQQNTADKVLVAGTDTIQIAKADTVMAADQMAISKSILAFVASINVNRIVINNGSLRFKDLKTSLEADCDSLFLSVRNMGYDFSKDSIFYNDSVYSCSVKNIKLVQPDGRYTLTVDEVYSKNTENITVKGIRHTCNVPKNKLAKELGNKPAIWSDLKIDEVKTSKVNIVRSVIKENIKIDSITVKGGWVELYQDMTYPYTTVQRPFQSMLLQLKMPLDVRKVKINLDKFDFTYTSGKFPPSTIGMNNMDVTVIRISNTDPRDLVVLAKCSIDNSGGYMVLNIRLLKDDLCSWRERIILENSNLKGLNGFLGNIAGAEVQGHVRRMECYAMGDSTTAAGTFCMEYKDLQAKIIKGKSPIKFLNENSKFVNGVVKAVLPPANPAKPGMKPKAYNVKGERELYKPYIIYMLSPMFEGLKSTMLAPFFIHKEIKEPKKALKSTSKSSVKSKR